LNLPWFRAGISYNRDMDPSEIELLDAMESSHWWYLNRKFELLSWVKMSPKDCSVIDVGSASGGNAKLLIDLGYNVTSLEMSDIGVRLQREKNIPVVQGDATSLLFESSSFDVVICMDVLEHIPEDELALSEIFRILKSGGRFLFTVPEDPKLWSSHDVAVSHVRRYTKKEFSEKIENAGFILEKVYSTNVLIRPIVILVRKFRDGNSLAPTSKAQNYLMRCVSDLERIFQLRHLPGVTLWATGTKPNEQ